jgi:UDP-N-acetylmuramoyl-tripeptide--D-alanyl-D-alanine ligase
MKNISIQQVLSWLTGATLHSKTHISLKKTSYGVNTDTRTLRTNNIFVALKGERFDGHRFIGFAARNQAALALVNYDSEESIKQAANEMPFISVADTGIALQQLAAGYRRQFCLPLALVVGSNGKTTTKEMLNSIFRSHLMIQGNERAAHSTTGNFNNDVGLPLTLLKLNDYHRLSVIELGMNHPGETAQLASVAAPTIAIINNAQREHQEFMHTVEAVAQEHCAVIPALASEGIVVLPAQDAYVQIWRDCAASHQKKVIDFALHINGDTTPALVTGEIHSLDDSPIIQTVKINTPLGTAQIKLNIAGEHHVRNALAATAAAIAANIPLSSIVLGLQAFEPVKGRMQPHHITVLNYARDIQLIDDTYNANPDSVIAAIDMLSQIKKLQIRSVLVLGDMGEVGDQGIHFHTEAGLYAAAKGISVLYTVGDLMKHAHNAFKNSTGNGDKHTQHFANTAELQAALLAKQTLHSNDTVLIKGSRFMRMEFIVEALLNQKMTESKQ